MSIILKPEHEQLIQAQISKGKYSNADEVVSEALKLLEEREQRLEDLRQKIAVGTKQIQKGQVTEGETFFAKSQTYHDLDALAGTWSDAAAAEFLSAIADFSHVDKELWQ
ncbi:type II toxin-antitoxin system ParD family antitoxin [Kovacikia minuta CCNUW1]|uniref:type II toxin-antitoxin system ParD family antitoxin n=1 Tax=Kovacikia minuta TaxID=2931930 RepID=UPI001CCE5FD6|nr:type II toxin-antitoxin system ParD family antitoxin [Kovacikia minuta]UBF24490.1 type II toxin-antitoxin system ParD family antitoxin [Kovacikia minuta CCNUW1]